MHYLSVNFDMWNATTFRSSPSIFRYSQKGLGLQMSYLHVLNLYTARKLGIGNLSAKLTME